MSHLKYLPIGQAWLLHTWDIVPSPWQSFPPYLGTGSVQRRLRYWTPPLQVTVQVSHGDQGPQPPSTRGYHKNNIQYLPTNPYTQSYICCLDYVVLYVFPVHSFFFLVNYYICFMSSLFHCVDICYLNIILYINIYWNSNSLGQGDFWQISVWRPSPRQSLPPIWGVGELQRRIRVMTPSPQVTEHEDQGDQWLQPPSCLTMSNTDKINSLRSLTDIWYSFFCKNA